MDRYIGRLLDNRYEILDIIGSGGMAVVYKARDHRLNRLVAIKILKDEFMEDEDFLRRFHAESRAVAMLSHPNIVSIYDVSNVEDKDYIVMELLDGITLKQYLERKKVLNWRETLHFAILIAEALEHAHSRKLVHRDIKPHNVMVLKTGAVKVTDFGIARMMENNNTMTKEAIGSVHYISPEQAKGGRVDERSDLYSLGVVMYEMITGRTPFDGDTPVAVAIAHINGGAARPSTIVPGIPKGLEQIIMRAMAHDLKDRYPSATEMLRDLNALRANPAFVFSYEEPVQMYHQMHHEGLQAERYGADPALVQNGAGEMGRRVVKKLEKTEEETEPPKGKLGVAAVIICSVVAIVAIIVFMILLTEKDMLSADFSGNRSEETGQPVQTTVDGDFSLHEPDASENRQTQAAVVATMPKPTNPVAQPIVMRNLVNLTRSEAEKLVDEMGLSNVQWLYQDSLLPADTVIGQTVAPDQPVDEEKILYVICAAGAVTKRCTFDMPFRTESYYLTIMLDGRPVVQEKLMEPFHATATFDLTGKGQQLCQLYIDGELYTSLKVDFDADE